jgi:1-acyl-sn-glycerol-3-phosphate acyltransferase
MSAVEAAGDGRVPPPRRRLGRVGLVVFNVLYWPYLFGTCAIFFWPALVIWIATAPFDPHLRFLHRYTSWWGAHYLAWAPFAGCKVEGRERLDPKRAYVFAANHQSMVDILAVFATHLPYKWVSKKENFFVPFIGWAMMLNRYVPLRRKHLPSIMTMFRASMRWLGQGVSVFVFPEGTRSPDRKLQPFHRGAFALACRTGAPIVPVMIEGTGEILGKGSFHIAPRPVVIRVLDPIDPAEAGGDSKRLRALVHARMLEEQGRMRGS